MKKLLNSIKSKSIALVYTYKNENAKGFSHYDTWGSGVISDWMKAIEELSCIPYIIDVRTFGLKGLNRTLPPIDFVINLNAGNVDINTLGLVPSICGFLGVPCIPSGTLQTVAGEHKGLSNLIAKTMNFNIPKSISNDSDKDKIFRPMNLGSSVGVRKNGKTAYNGIFQEFISGFDITTPILYNSNSKKLEVLPSLLYNPDNNDINWIFGENVKAKSQGYKKIIVDIDTLAKEFYLNLVRAYEIKTFCRIDVRIKCDNYDEINDFINKPIPFDKLYFLEVNSMPTIREGINFCNSIKQLPITSNMYTCYNQYCGELKNATPVGFILLNSIAAIMNTTTMRYKSQD